MKDCDGSPPDPEAEAVEEGSEVNFIFVRLNVLRECLEKELTNHSLPFEWDLEVHMFTMNKLIIAGIMLFQLSTIIFLFQVTSIVGCCTSITNCFDLKSI